MADINVPGANVNVDPSSIVNSPAYKFRMEQGQQALTRNAAGRGTLLTGGTLKDAIGYGQGLASTEFDKDFGRQFQLAGLNADIGQGNAGRNLQGLLGLYGGVPMAQRALRGQQGRMARPLRPMPG